MRNRAVLCSYALVVVLPLFVHLAAANRFCNETVTYTIYTECTNCVSVADGCPQGTLEDDNSTMNTIANCTYRLPLSDIVSDGCQRVCHKMDVRPECCQGYWGRDCDECPGHANNNTCFGNGECSDGRHGNGTCACDVNFIGTACELCRDNDTYGEKCDKECLCVHGQCDGGINGRGTCTCDPAFTGPSCDQALLSCDTFTCEDNEKCVMESPTSPPECVCVTGFHNKTGVCQVINPCDDGPCHQMADCHPIHYDAFQCECWHGFAGDGYFCEAIDPCQVNNGGCPTVFAECVYIAPNMSDCRCVEGFEATADNSCSLVDVCTRNLSACHPQANCTTIGPLQASCTCREGYSGDGQRCTGHIIQVLKDLNSNHPSLLGQLNYALLLIESTYASELSRQGPLTFFAPTDQGFRSSLSHQELARLGTDTDLARHFINQHLVAKAITVKRTNKDLDLFTLQGNGAKVNIKKFSRTLRYKLVGSGKRGRIIKADVPASNGVVQIINSFMDMDAQISWDKTKTLAQLILSDGRYNRFESLLEASGQLDMLSNSTQHVTVFAPNNAAFDSLPKHTLDYLLSAAGRGKLKSLIGSHIINGTEALAINFVNMNRLQSIGHVSLPVRISNLGRIKLLNNVNILQTDIRASNGYYHNLDKVLIPDELKPLLPSQCNEQKTVMVLGRCSKYCVNPKCPLESDIPKSTIRCRYQGSSFFPFFDIRRSYRRSSCRKTCTRKTEVPKCCSGFFGKRCTPCPGGFTNPCNGHGQCEDGINGRGTCKCDANFSGTACEFCRNTSMTGSNCTTPCTCLHGVCDNRIKSDGRCKKNSCDDLYRGVNCDQKLACQILGVTKWCHDEATCVIDTTATKAMLSKSYFRLHNLEDEHVMCACKNGYRGDGSGCKEIDRCAEPDRGGCHSQATCVKTSPGQNNCTCDKGWIGDGLYCVPSMPCTTHSDCHDNATCEDSSPGEFICQCNDGFHGNGMNCLPTNSCTVNNGGCHDQAVCRALAPGVNNCTCFKGLEGDGYDYCYASLVEQLNKLANITTFNTLVKSLPQPDDLWDITDDFTVFAPLDLVLLNFTQLSEEGFWTNEKNLVDFFRYHTVPTGIPYVELDDGRNTTMYQSLYEDFNITVVFEGGDMFVNGARVIKRNNLAINGIIHIIDEVLEPVSAVARPVIPTVEELMSTKPELSIFLLYLKETKLLSVVNNLGSYTLLVPTNEAWQEYHTHVTSRYLSYYILPQKLPVDMIDDVMNVQTLLGDRLGVVFEKVGISQIHVNNVSIVQTDLQTDKGVIHVLAAMLNPVLNRCDATVTKQMDGYCVPCERLSIPCPYGFSPLEPSIRRPCRYKNIHDHIIQTYVGCKVVCQKTLVQPFCCDGYFGSMCKACPGGADNSCHGRGSCDDGLYGTGDCHCHSRYTGFSCENCALGYTGANCSTDVDPCLDDNGGCHGNATCQFTSDRLINCTCKTGYLGNGFQCDADPCLENNGGCHDKAKCIAIDDRSWCRCMPGYHGDGVTCTHLCESELQFCDKNAVCSLDFNHLINCTCVAGYTGSGETCKEINKCLINHGGCHVNANCSFDDGDVAATCSCSPGYVGNGSWCLPDPCVMENGHCDGNATCTPQMNASVVCSCNLGYHGDGYTCIYNACLIDNGACDENAVCHYNKESVSCTCLKGYYGNGTECMEVENKCLTSKHGCSKHAVCQFVLPDDGSADGDVYCSCIEGFVGDGTFCNSDIYSTISTMVEARLFYQGLLFGSQDDDHHDFDLMKNVADSRHNVIDLLQDVSQNLTLFLPVNDAMKHSQHLTQLDLETHVLNQRFTFVENGDNENFIKQAMSGNMLLLLSIHINNTVLHLVNGIQVIRGNIPAVNGFIHLISQPLTFSNVSITEPLASKQEDIGVTVVIGVVVTSVLILVGAAVVISVFAHKKKTGHYFWAACLRKNVTPCSTFKRFDQSPAPASLPYSEGSASPARSFDNPLYDNTTETATL